MKGMCIEGNGLTTDDFVAIGIFLQKRFSTRKDIIHINLTSFKEWDLSLEEVSSLTDKIFKGAKEWIKIKYGDAK